MSVFGPDFRAGLVRPLYQPVNPVGLGGAIAIFIGLVVFNQVLQVAFGIGLHPAAAMDPLNQQLLLRSVMIGLLPAGMCTALLAWGLAFVCGGRPATALVLRFPTLGIGGWAAITLGFLFALYLIVALAVNLLSIDTSSRGAVETAMAALGRDRA